MSSVEVAEKVFQLLMFFAPQILEGGTHEILWGICKSTSVLTYWLRSHSWSLIYADEIKTNNRLQR